MKFLFGTTSNEVKVTAPGSHTMDRALFQLDVTQENDSSTVRVEHHWAGPQGLNPMNFKLSSSRYWRVTGSLSNSFEATARMSFNRFPNQGSLDADLLSHSEDSIILLYRKDARSPWLEYPYYSKNMLGNPNNGFGRMELSKVLPGEYVFANGESTLGLEEHSRSSKLKLYPNPSDSVLNVSFKKSKSARAYRIFSADGRLVQQGIVDPQVKQLELDLNILESGSYIFSLENTNKPFVINH